MKAIKIEVGTASQSVLHYGDQLARITYDNGQDVFLFVKACGSESGLVQDVLNPGIMQVLISIFVNKPSGERRLGEEITDWRPIYVDNRLRVV